MHPRRDPLTAASRTNDTGLAQLVRERISVRLGKRIRDLSVQVESGVIRLSGKCSTYYSKQLAQHAVLGVVEDEEIENQIEVAVPSRVCRG
ncbi:BON domain protein [Planctomycetes bacterium MalM25]|nr:BON domain protein [Planctomycetes bacterium MalM25]